MTGHRAATVVATISFALIGCAGDGLGPTSSVLSATEAVPLARAVISQFRALSDANETPFTLNRTGQADDSPDAATLAQPMGPRDSITVVQSSEVSAPCVDDRGMARLERTLAFRIDGETASGNVEGDLALSLVQCALTTDEGHRFILTTNSPLALHAAFTVMHGEPVGETIQAQFAGSFAWQRGVRSGNCDIELTVTIVIANGALRAQGDFCGAGIDQTL